MRPTWTNVPATGLLNPNPVQSFSASATITTAVHTSAVTAAGYVLDTMNFGKHWDVTGGIRWDRFDARILSWNMLIFRSISTKAPDYGAALGSFALC